MAGANMATITDSLERSLQNCSLNHYNTNSNSSSGSFPTTKTSDSSENQPSETTLDLNSEISLPYHWEQCLDLKTGEVYYINWRTGMKVKEDPRTNNNIYSEEDDDDDDDSAYSYDSEGSSSAESSCNVSKELQQHSHESSSSEAAEVLVVAGCKSCLMYYMVPKQVDVCPKCCGLLLHFNPSHNTGSS